MEAFILVMEIPRSNPAISKFVGRDEVFPSSVLTPPNRFFDSVFYSDSGHKKRLDEHTRYPRIYNRRRGSGFRGDLEVG